MTFVGAACCNVCDYSQFDVEPLPLSVPAFHPRLSLRFFTSRFCGGRCQGSSRNFSDFMLPLRLVRGYGQMTNLSSNPGNFSTHSGTRRSHAADRLFELTIDSIAFVCRSAGQLPRTIGPIAHGR